MNQNQQTCRGKNGSEAIIVYVTCHRKIIALRLKRTFTSTHIDCPHGQSKGP